MRVPLVQHPPHHRDELRQSPENAKHLLDMNLAHIAAVGPDFGAVGGSSQLRAIVGALLTYGLIISVLMVVTCGATWAISSSNGSWHAASNTGAIRTDRPARVCFAFMCHLHRR